MSSTPPRPGSQLLLSFRCMSRFLVERVTANVLNHYLNR